MEMYVLIDVVTCRKVRAKSSSRPHADMCDPVNLHIRRELQPVERNPMRETIAETEIVNDVLRGARQHPSIRRMREEREASGRL